MDIPESHHTELNHALLELHTQYRQNSNFRPEIMAEIHALVDECCRLPEWQTKEHYMDAGLAAVTVYLKKTYPWLTQKGFYAVRHQCMVAMK